MSGSWHRCSCRFVSIVCLTLLVPVLSVHAHAVNTPAEQAASVAVAEELKPVDGPKEHTASEPRKAAKSSDEYVVRHQQRCFQTRSLPSCLKYKAAKALWALATNGWGLVAAETPANGEGRDAQSLVRFVHLSEPSEIRAFGAEMRGMKDDNEFGHLLKFLLRACETFGRSHAVQLLVPAEVGARVYAGDMARGHGDRRKRKWLIILPLIILMKIAHLKMTVVTLLLGVLGLNVLLVGAVGWLIHYLKFKTLCKIHPQLVQHHSHVYDSDPSDYSSFVGSSFPGSHYGSSASYEGGGYNKDWASSKAYKGYNYLDTISKRLQ